MAIQTRQVEYKDGDILLEAYMAWDDSSGDHRPGVLARLAQGSTTIGELAGNRSFDQPGVLEDLHVLADSRLADLKGRGQFADGGRALREPRKDAAPGAIGEGEKDLVELLARLQHRINS